jgi:hypothetical protein
LTAQRAVIEPYCKIAKSEIRVRISVLIHRESQAWLAVADDKPPGWPTTLRKMILDAKRFRF